jgi:hypothetical protein
VIVSDDAGQFNVGISNGADLRQDVPRELIGSADERLSAQFPGPPGYCAGCQA